MTAWPAFAAARLGLSHGAPRSTFATAFKGRAASWAGERDLVVIDVRDRLHDLERPLQTDLYSGAGGLNGGTDLAGKPKPLAYGKTFNVAPVFLGVIDLGDGLLNTYQVHDGTIRDVPAVRDRGAELTKVTAAPSASEYRVHAASGVFQLGGTATGQVTCDIEGDADPTFITDAASILKRLLKDRVSLTDADLDLTAFSEFAYLQPAEIGCYFGPTPVTALAACAQLLAGTSAFLTANRAAQFRPALLIAPAPPAQFTLDASRIISIDPVPLPEQIAVPAKRIQVGWRPNYAPSDDLAGSVTGADRLALIAQWRVAAAFSDSVAAAHELGREPPLVPGLYWYADDALAEAQRLLALYAWRRLFRVRTQSYLGQIELGHVGQLTWPEFGLDNGWYGVVTRWRENPVEGFVEVEMFG